MSVLNLSIQSQAYDDHAGLSNNPNQRAWDWTRNLSNLQISNPTSDKKTIPVGGSLSLFNGSRSTSLNGSSIMETDLLSANDSAYQLLVSAGPAGFRTARSVTGITGCAVTINNNALAVFTFSGATVTALQVGDIMRIAGAALYDIPPFAFSPSNAGLWVVIGINTGTGAISVVRPTGTPFVGVQESPVTVNPSDVEFYSAAGVQIGDRLAISGVFSPVTQNTYVVTDVTPNSVQFVSTNPIPQESGLTYTSGSITFYSSSKRFIYIEVDQQAAIQFNADASLNTTVQPVNVGSTSCVGAPPPSGGDPLLVGSLLKWGNSYACTVVNMSVNPLNVKFCLGE